MANNIVLNPQKGDSFALTGVASAYNQPSAFQPIGVTVYSTASIAANANNALLGKALTITGFAAAGNNGTFLVVASTATTVTVNNASGVVVVAAGTASYLTQGTPASYASKVQNLQSNQTGDSVYVNASAGDTLVAVIVGMKSYQPFDLLHGATPDFGFLQGLNDFNANPSISDQANGVVNDITATSITSNVLTVTVENNGQSAFSAGQTVVINGTQESFLNGQTFIVLAGATATQFTVSIVHSNYSNPVDTGTVTPAGNTWTLINSLNIADSDPISPSYTTSSQWNLDQYYPSIYIYAAQNVKAGSYKVSLNSMYGNAGSAISPPDFGAPQDWAQGSVPIFDGGVNIQVFCISGAALSGGLSSSISSGTPAETTSNPATAPSTLILSGGDGGALLSIGLMKSGNVFGPGTSGGSPPVTATQISNGVLVGSEAHYVVQFASVSTGTWNPGFSNPLGYPMLVASLAISST